MIKRPGHLCYFSFSALPHPPLPWSCWSASRVGFSPAGWLSTPGSCWRRFRDHGLGARGTVSKALFNTIDFKSITWKYLFLSLFANEMTHLQRRHGRLPWKYWLNYDEQWCFNFVNHVICEYLKQLLLVGPASSSDPLENVSFRESESEWGNKCTFGKQSSIFKKYPN